MKHLTLQPPFTAFKEWHAICDALISGVQHVILRKGGIAEGRGGFAFQHPEFLLFPTFFHAQYDGIRTSAKAEAPFSDKPRQEVTFTACCQIVAQAVLTDWEAVERLQPFHIWTSDLLRERFDYGDHQALHLAVVRTYRLRSLTIPFEKRYGGCRSWVLLPLTEPLEGESVVTNDHFQSTYKDIASALGESDLEHH